MLRMWKGVFAGSLDGIMGQGVDNWGGPEVCANSYLGLECPRVTGVFCGYSRRYFSEALRLIWLTETEGEILWITKIHVGCLHSQLGNCEYILYIFLQHVMRTIAVDVDTSWEPFKQKSIGGRRLGDEDATDLICEKVRLRMRNKRRRNICKV